MPALRIGLTQRVTDLPDRGERRDALDQAWPHLVADLGWIPIPLPNRGLEAGPAVRELALDGIILTGGNDLAHLGESVHAAPERDAFEAGLVEVATERDLPVFAVCRGLQFLVAHYGGRLRPVTGHVAVRHPVEASPKRLPLPDRIEVNSFHDWGVQLEDVPGCLQVEAVAMDGTIEALSHRNHPQWAVMWHPERSPHLELDRQLMRRLFDPEALR